MQLSKTKHLKFGAPQLIGLPFENGIKMMQRMRRGVTGTAAAPKVVLEQAAKLKLPWESQLVDLQQFSFDVTPENRDDPQTIAAQNNLTLQAHDFITEVIEATARAGKTPVVIGGDHSLTFPIFRGLCRAHPRHRFAVIVVDAHWDMRPPESFGGVDGLISSGNSFYRILTEPIMPAGKPKLAYFGIEPQQSTIFQEMADFARRHEVIAHFRPEMDATNVAKMVLQTLDELSRIADGIYLSLDIDAVHEQFAPGVSAPAKNGLSPAIWLQIVRTIAENAPLIGVDIVEASARTRHWSALFPQEAQVPPAAEDVLTPTAALVVQTLLQLQRSWQPA